ncbi:S9 family peptidase [Olivibacter sitiensis]|uniref:S9 family peptidase n=1 Tax=Olivibacter sitiensis TaxID=376470 RepID=UPI00040092C5|nr:S9 family peptidase [Olivibacter sitiensis]
MTKTKFSFFSFFAVFLLVVPAIGQEKELIKVTDMVKLQRVGNLQVNLQDKSMFAFEVNSIKPRKGSEVDFDYDSQLWIGSLRDKTSIRQMTYADESKNMIGFDPSGSCILFLKRVDGKNQLFSLPLDGGEAKQMTDFSYGVSNPIWSPNGQTMIFSVSMNVEDLVEDTVFNSHGALPTWSDEKPGYKGDESLVPNKEKANPDGNLDEIRAYLQKNVHDSKAKVINKLQFQGEANTTSEMRIGHLMRWNFASEERPVALTKGFRTFSNAYFLDDDHLLVHVKADTLSHPDKVLENEVYEMTISTGQLKRIYGAPGKSFNVVAASHSGNYLIVSSSEVGSPNVPVYSLIDRKRGSEEVFDEDRNLTNFKWDDKERVLYFTKQANGSLYLCRKYLDGSKKKVEVLSKEDEGISDYILCGEQLVYVHTTVNNPSELEVADSDMAKSKPISSFNASWLAGKMLSMPTKHHFTNDEGMDVEYWVMKPVGFKSGKKYPLLLEIHGGPAAMWGPSELSMWHEYQYFCSQGYGVVYSNPRGSGGYGNDFLRANMDNWGEGPASDVLEALDRTVAEGWADTSKLVITGGSYAGYLVSWIIGHDQRFAAACSQRGVYDLKTFFGEGNAWRLVPNYFGGYPWEKDVEKVLYRESPINYVQNIHTPYLIFHGENDLRTGVIQSEMLYKSLKVLGRPVEYVRHPGATHEITRSGDNRQRIDQMLRTYEFFERFIH